MKKLLAALLIAHTLPAAAFAHRLSAAEAREVCFSPALRDSAVQSACLTGRLILRAYVVAVSVAGKSFTLNMNDGDPPALVVAQGVEISLMPRPMERTDRFVGNLSIHDDSAPQDKQLSPDIAVLLKQGKPLEISLPTGKTVTLNLIASDVTFASVEPASE